MCRRWRHGMGSQRVGRERPTYAKTPCARVSPHFRGVPPGAWSFMLFPLDGPVAKLTFCTSPSLRASEHTGVAIRFPSRLRRIPTKNGRPVGGHFSRNDRSFVRFAHVAAGPQITNMRGRTWCAPWSGDHACPPRLRLPLPTALNRGSAGRVGRAADLCPGKKRPPARCAGAPGVTYSFTNRRRGSRRSRCSAGSGTGTAAAGYIPAATGSWPPGGPDCPRPGSC